MHHAPHAPLPFIPPPVVTHRPPLSWRPSHSTHFTHHFPFTSPYHPLPSYTPVSLPPPPGTQGVYAATCPSRLRPAPRRTHTLTGTPHTSGMDVRLAGEAHPLRVRGPYVPPPDHCGSSSTAVTASSPQTPGPRSSHRLSRAPALPVRTDRRPGIRQPRHRQSSGVITHMCARTPLTWSRGYSNVSRPSGQHAHQDNTSEATRRCLTDTCRLISVPRYGGLRGPPPATWGRHLPLSGQWVAPLETTCAGIMPVEF